MINTDNYSMDLSTLNFALAGWEEHRANLHEKLAYENLTRVQIDNIKAGLIRARQAIQKLETQIIILEKEI
jgi:hypothetical protein